MRKTQISPAIIQEMFESAGNAAAKGQAQWFTPAEWARILALPLPSYRPAIADLNCGNGALLKAASRHFAKQLGCDIQPQAGTDYVAADLTKFYSLLRAVKWKCDLFALNPPWDLHWYRDKLKALAGSECPAVRDAFAAHDGRTTRDTIDSTVATFCIALDRCSDCGEGFLIGNEASLQRLIFAKDAPHHALATHVWAHLTIEGNICQSNGGRPQGHFKTGVIYFMRSPQPKCHRVYCPSLAVAKAVCDDLRKNRLLLRKGPEAIACLHTKNSAELWQAAAEESLRLATTQTKPQYNIWLGDDGLIRTYLSLFDQHSGRVPKKDADTLFALTGRQPIQLVMQRSHRKALEAAVAPGSLWRADPALQAAVQAAIAEYNAVRAPLYPLSKIQRLGYLDEQDEIKCLKNLKGVFLKGKSYPLHSTTLAVKRHGTKMNLEGGEDAVEWNGQELAFFILDENGVQRCFMEGRLRDSNIEVNVLVPDGKPGNKRDVKEECKIDFALEELVEHFHIPDVPDVATLNPQGYRRNLDALDEIVALCNDGRPQGPHRFELKRFQREDYARAALHDGIILGHDTGLGKTIAAFLWPLLKVGWLKVLADGNRLRPAKPVLLVVPGDGHDQTGDESQKHFKTGAVRFDSQETFFKLSKLDPRSERRSLPPHYYITSYTQLSGNGVMEIPKLDRARPERTMAALNLKEPEAVDWFNRRGKIYQTEYEYLDATPETSWSKIHSVWMARRKEFAENESYIESLDKAYDVLKNITPQDARRKNISFEQWKFVRAELAAAKLFEFTGGIGLSRNGIKCVYSPTLADLCQDCFGAIVVDEGTKIKGEESHISLGVRQINAPYRLVMSATPIKNRFPDVFRLAHYVCGGHDEPTPRFPYGDYDRNDFAQQFLFSERKIEQDENGKTKRGYPSLTPQVCNVHRAWKLFAPIILRRRKDDCGEEIVPKRRHVVRVPMGLSQAAVYQHYLNGKLFEIFQSLRIAAANPASALLPEARSRYDYIPKVATVLSLIQQALERGEQVVVFGAFTDSLDVVSARLREAGVKYLVLDGRTSQKKRGQLARLFKWGPPRAFKAGLTSRQSEYPVLLAGIECMAELHSFPLCNNVILGSFSLALDKVIQAINRVHRLNSPWPVDMWGVICQGSIERKLEASIHEKSDASELVLDGRLFGEHFAEVNLAELLCTAHKEFSQVKTIDELELEKGWPRLRAALGKAFLKWNANASPALAAFASNSPLPASQRHLNLPLWRRRLWR